jgi:hypothetical protein
VVGTQLVLVDGLIGDGSSTRRGARQVCTSRDLDIPAWPHCGSKDLAKIFGTVDCEPFR